MDFHSKTCDLAEGIYNLICSPVYSLIAHVHLPVYTLVVHLTVYTLVVHEHLSVYTLVVHVHLHLGSTCTFTPW